MNPGSIWISECKQYVAQYVGRDVLDVIVYAVDGSARWVDGPSPRHGECCRVPRLVTGWANNGRTLRSGRWVDDFEILFADVDMSVPIISCKGNAVTAQYRARFRRRLRWLPKALRGAAGEAKVCQ